MEEVATIQNSTASDQDSVPESAASARLGQQIGQQMVSWKVAQIKATLSALDTINDGKNKILDIDPMMTALNHYFDKGEGGQRLVYQSNTIPKISKSGR